MTNQTVTLADRTIGNYRTPAPTVRETQWKMARQALAQVLAVNPNDGRIKGALRYCDGHLHRINGEARKAHKQNADAQHEFTEAVSAFREAAELRPAWPDPFLGLMRTFIYGLEDVDRGADALKQAQRLGYTAGARETVQLADGYRSRAMTFARTARTLSGTGGRTGGPQAIGRRVSAGDRSLFERPRLRRRPRSLRAAQRGLRAGRTAKRRIVRPAFDREHRGHSDLASQAARDDRHLHGRRERRARQKQRWTDRIGLSLLSLPPPPASRCWRSRSRMPDAPASSTSRPRRGGRARQLNTVADVETALDAVMAASVVRMRTNDELAVAAAVRSSSADERQKTRPLPNVGAIAPLFSQADFAKLKPLFTVRTIDEFRRQVVLFGCIYILAFQAAMLVWRLRGIRDRSASLSRSRIC